MGIAAAIMRLFDAQNQRKVEVSADMMSQRHTMYPSYKSSTSSFQQTKLSPISQSGSHGTSSVKEHNSGIHGNHMINNTVLSQNEHHIQRDISAPYHHQHSQMHQY